MAIALEIVPLSDSLDMYGAPDRRYVLPTLYTLFLTTERFAHLVLHIHSLDTSPYLFTRPPRSSIPNGVLYEPPFNR